jgi:hypothetical protein
MFTINKVSVPFAWRIDFIPSRVKVFVLIDSCVISRNRYKLRSKKSCTRTYDSLFDVNIQVKTALSQRRENHAIERQSGRQSARSEFEQIISRNISLIEDLFIVIVCSGCRIELAAARGGVFSRAGIPES